jgi:hypothetical protein
MGDHPPDRDGRQEEAAQGPGGMISLAKMRCGTCQDSAYDA